MCPSNEQRVSSHIRDAYAHTGADPLTEPVACYGISTGLTVSAPGSDHLGPSIPVLIICMPPQLGAVGDIALNYAAFEVLENDGSKHVSMIGNEHALTFSTHEVAKLCEMMVDDSLVTLVLRRGTVMQITKPFSGTKLKSACADIEEGRTSISDEAEVSDGWVWPRPHQPGHRQWPTRLVKLGVSEALSITGPGRGNPRAVE